MRARKPNERPKRSGRAKATKAATERTQRQRLLILSPPTLRTAENVAEYLEGEFADVLRAAVDLVATGAYCPVELLEDLAYVAEGMAQVLRGGGAVEFDDESFEYADALGRSLRELAGRVDGVDYDDVHGMAGTLWRSTMPTLARLLGRAEKAARVERRARRLAARSIAEEDRALAEEEASRQRALARAVEGAGGRPKPHRRAAAEAAR